MSQTLEIERRPVGGSGFGLPRIALGCGNFGGIGSSPAFFGHGLDERQAFELMDAAWELGITHFDTADAYGGGRSETTIGRWIRERGVTPQLTTKTFNPMDAGADSGLAPERIARALDASLERLGVGSVELYLAHEFDPEVPVVKTFGALESAINAGKVRAYGVSNWNAEQLADGLRAGSPVAVQNSHSLLDRQDERDLLPLCQERGVAYLAFGPLGGGWLTGKYRRGEPYPEGSRMTQRPEPYEAIAVDRTFDALEGLQVLAGERGSSMAGLALAWLLSDGRVTQIVVGPGRPEQLDPVREALANPLATGERAELDRLFS
jgi:aryl-alcohol dehydrogenase-like predicted oxidoreductase